MADTRVPKILGTVDANGNVIPSTEFARVWNELFNGKGPASVGSLLSGVNTATGKLNQIEAGTLPVADVLISGRGSLNTQQDAQDNNTQSASSAASTAGGGSLVASISPSSLSGVGTNVVSTGDGGGSSSCTVTPSGGTGPYSYAWTKVSGTTITVSSPAAATTGFSTTLIPGQLVTAVYRCTVTDSLLATATADVSITLFDNSSTL